MGTVVMRKQRSSAVDGTGPRQDLFCGHSGPAPCILSSSVFAEPSVRNAWLTCGGHSEHAWPAPGSRNLQHSSVCVHTVQVCACLSTNTDEPKLFSV